MRFADCVKNIECQRQHVSTVKTHVQAPSCLRPYSRAGMLVKQTEIRLHTIAYSCHLKGPLS